MSKDQISGKAEGVSSAECCASAGSSEMKGGTCQKTHKHSVLVRTLVVLYLQPHVSSVSLQLLPQLVLGQLFHVQDGMLPLYLLHAVRVVGHILANPHLAQGVPVASVGSFEVLHQVHQCPQLQRLEHEVLPPAEPQRPEASPAVDPQHDVMEVVS